MFFTQQGKQVQVGEVDVVILLISQKNVVDGNKISKQDIKNFSPTSKSNRRYLLDCVPYQLCRPWRNYRVQY